MWNVGREGLGEKMTRLSERITERAEKRNDTLLHSWAKEVREMEQTIWNYRCVIKGFLIHLDHCKLSEEEKIKLFRKQRLEKSLEPLLAIKHLI